MAPMSRQPQDLKPGRSGPGGQPGSGAPGGSDRNWRVVAVVLALVVLAVLASSLLGSSTKPQSIGYGDLVAKTTTDPPSIKSVEISNATGKITAETLGGEKFSVSGPNPAIQDDVTAFRQHGVKVTFKNASSNLIASLLPTLLLVGLIVGFWVWMSRRAQGQMGNLMSIGRAKAKVYTTERPRTTFADVAGYNGVKLEIKEVVEFLRSGAKFKEIGAKIPKGVLLVGPPGTGKTLLARAVAGEAGVPFLSITGSDFMEMFVGVGASRVRDLFQTARKQAPAIIFIDEIDSIGRKRGAGLGGGHDEREQTLNQMLAEMDGFEATEGIVILAATNRPDILDPALLRPGRFDRQIVVPLPDLDERLPILQVHCKDKKMGPDVNLSVVSRGTPGMSGADLANLVNEAALHAVRRSGHEVTMADFEAARDRILMGQRRESVILSPKEKEATAYHEGGHAVLAYVLPESDPVHKVTILPTGMALGVTQQLPIEERHSYWREYIEDALVVLMGGRCAERLVLDSLSTGASNDLQRATEMARKMVREFGMSERVGPMAWGSDSGAVFLGEDLMHSRDYSDVTSRVIDEEVERILREQEERAMTVLTEHREGLNAVAKALLEKETINGEEVSRLVDAAYGRPVHPTGAKALGGVPQFVGVDKPLPPPPVPQHEPAPAYGIAPAGWPPPALS